MSIRIIFSSLTLLWCLQHYKQYSPPNDQPAASSIESGNRFCTSLTTALHDQKTSGQQIGSGQINIFQRLTTSTLVAKRKMSLHVLHC